MPKSAAERQRDYRERKRHSSCMESNKTKTQAKSAAQRTREYRERKRVSSMVNTSVNLNQFENLTEVYSSPAIYPMVVHEHFTALSTSMSENVSVSYSSLNNSSMTTLSEVVLKLKKLAPLSLAGSWDNVGLLVEPDVKKPIQSVFLTNDLTEDVLEEAESVNANLIISYHPPVFTPFKRITLDTWKGRIVSRCLSQGIAVYSPHTSWDAVENGLTDWLISCFDGKILPIKPLSASPEFSHVATLSSNIDGLRIHEIVECQSDLEGKKDFKVLNTDHSQLQLLCNSSVLSMLNDLATSHKDIYLHVNKNESLPYSNPTSGDGRYCRFKDELTIGNAVQMIKSHLGVNNLMIAMARGSTMDSKINSAAAVAGSGASLLRGVKADLYLTGEMSHHDLLDAVHDNVTVVLANHSNTERSYLKVFAGKLLEELPQLTVHVSKVDRDPLVFV